MMITKLEDQDIGRWIKYVEFDGSTSSGKIKSFNNETQIAWVVYDCGGNWSDYRNYTGQATSYRDLKF